MQTLGLLEGYLASLQTSPYEVQTDVTRSETPRNNSRFKEQTHPRTNLEIAKWRQPLPQPLCHPGKFLASGGSVLGNKKGATQNHSANLPLLQWFSWS